MINSFEGEYEFLSNFYLCKVVYKGIEYKSSEHAYQASKTITKEDHDMIMNSSSPGKAKRLGNEIKIRPDWNDVKYLIMEEILLCKFGQNKDLLKKLYDTGDQELIEGNWWKDTYWGVCDGIGKNNLGKILMNIRNGNIL